VDPEFLRAGMRIGVLIALLAAITLPFQDPSSASFVVDVLALVIGLLFIAGVAMVARLTSSRLPAPSPPRARDRSIADRYNERNPGATRTGAPAPGGKEE
jgi:hypothetical protein